MTTLVIVEHHLNPAGIAYSPAWVEEVGEVLGSWPGFISIQPIQKVDDTDVCCLLMLFRSLAELRAWSASEQHTTVLNLIKPYQLQKQRSQLYTLTGQIVDL